jgi:hypothetical protein
MIATPREASGPASGGWMTIFAGGSLPMSGITWGEPQPSLALCAAAGIAHNAMAATDSRNVHLKLVGFNFAMFLAPFPFTASGTR